ncbi:unnamed protein product [Bursaphelenchus okinawaensis]|uniref:Uncharacterized protein n=1 Tax=Bursaphelenchus okinawaensis TaxID=465554 RepID=A0A811LPF8_9BILA|nr:unnamed protein product [Bursaphelenchus okinawaensis]CAG9127586.1 unnamed protein product [Bursaphelenchus okinawaensis]
MLAHPTLAIICVASVFRIALSENVRWVELEEHTADFPFDEDAARKAEAAFKITVENNAAGEIVRRIEKMFNDSIDGYERSVSEGDKQLKVLQETNNAVLPHIAYLMLIAHTMFILLLRQ